MQIKLMLIALMLELEIGYENGLKERPQNVVVGAKCVPSMTQKVILRRGPQVRKFIVAVRRFCLQMKSDDDKK